MPIHVYTWKIEVGESVHEKNMLTHAKRNVRTSISAKQRFRILWKIYNYYSPATNRSRVPGRTWWWSDRRWFSLTSNDTRSNTRWRCQFSLKSVFLQWLLAFSSLTLFNALCFRDSSSDCATLCVGGNVSSRLGWWYFKSQGTNIHAKCQV